MFCVECLAVVCNKQTRCFILSQAKNLVISWFRLTALIRSLPWYSAPRLFRSLLAAVGYGNQVAHWFALVHNISYITSPVSLHLEKIHWQNIIHLMFHINLIMRDGWGQASLRALSVVFFIISVDNIDFLWS